MIAARAPAYIAEHFAKTINALKGQVTMLFIAHPIPKGLKLEGVVQIRNLGHGASGTSILFPMKRQRLKEANDECC